MRALMSDQGMRHALRQPVEMSGWIVGDDGRSRPCVVSNLSPDGAKLTVLSRDPLPVQFTLLVEDVKHRSRLVWQTGLHAGVQFVRDAAHAPAVGSATGPRLAPLEVSYSRRTTASGR